MKNEQSTKSMLVITEDNLRKNYYLPGQLLVLATLLAGIDNMKLAYQMKCDNISKQCSFILKLGKKIEETFGSFTLINDR